MNENMLMTRTRWRILAVISALLLAMGLAAAPALAYYDDDEGYEPTPDLRVGSWSLQLNDTPTIPGVTYDKASNTVTLTNVEIYTDESMYGGILYCDYQGNKDLTIKLVGTNKFHLGDQYSSGIRTELENSTTVRITGGGSLTVDGGHGALLFNCDPYDGESKASIIIDGVNLSADTAGIAMGYGDLTIKNSTISVNSKISAVDGFYGIDCYQHLSIQNSRVEIKNTAGAAKLLGGLDYVNMSGEKAYVGDGKAQCSLTAAELEGYYRGNYLLFTTEDFGLPACVVANPDITFSPASLKYNGKPQRPKVIVKVKGKTVAASNYTVEWDDDYEPVGAIGAHKAIVTMKGTYLGARSASYKVVKADNPLTAKAKVKAKTFKYAKVKKATQSVKLSKLISVSKAVGEVTYKKKSGNKKITVKGGKLSVKKGLKKGAYAVKVSVTAAGDGNYNKGAKVVTFKVKVK